MNDELLARLLDRSAALSDVDLAAVAADPELRLRLATLLAVDEDLDRVLSPERVDFPNRVQRLLRAPRSSGFAKRVVRRNRREPLRFLPWALVAAAGLAIALFWPERATPPPAPPAPLTPLTPLTPLLAREWTAEVAQRVTLDRGQVLDLEPGARARVADDGSLALTGGALMAVVPPLARGWQVHTPQATITVHGTRFRINVHNERTEVALHEGRIELTSAAGRLDLAAGEEAEVLAGRPPQRRPVGLVLTHPGSDVPLDLPMSPVLRSLEDADHTLMAWYRPARWPAAEGTELGFAAILIRPGWACGLAQMSDGRFLAQRVLADRSVVGAAAEMPTPRGRWCHLAQVVEPQRGRLRLFIDGVEVGSNAWTPGAPAFDHGDQPWRIGYHKPGEWIAQGPVRGVRIYGRALTAAEVAELARDAPL